MSKTGYKWDAVPVDGVSVDDLDKESFDIFRREALRSGRMIEEDLNMDNGQLLDSLGLIENGKLKRAAILLFHRNPEKWVTGAYIKIGYFGEGSDLRYQDEIHGSVPYNPNIANGFFRAGYVETWGRGIEKICEECKSYGVPIPEYTLHLEDIMVKFKPLEQSKVQNGTLNDTLNGTLEENILLVIGERPNITQSQIALSVDCSERKVKRIMKDMTEKGIIERVGGRKMGKWIKK